MQWKGMFNMDWKRKLTSRKLWTSISGFVTLVAVGAGMDESSAAQIASIIMAGAVVLGYVIGEGLVDRAHKKDGDSNG